MNTTTVLRLVVGIHENGQKGSFVDFNFPDEHATPENFISVLACARDTIDTLITQVEQRDGMAGGALKAAVERAQGEHGFDELRFVTIDRTDETGEKA